MTQEIEERQAAQVFRKGGGKHLYYRLPDGWIGSDNTNEFERIKRIDEGWQPLRQYGVFDFTRRTVDEPFHNLIRNGGAKEFPVDQLIAMGWAYKPPVIDGKVTEFPQLEGADIPPSKTCCNRTMTPEAYEQHRSVMHTGAQQQQQLGTAIAEGLKDALKPQSEHPFVCGICGVGFDNVAGLSGHAKEHDA